MEYDSKKSAMFSFSAVAHTTSVTHTVHSLHPSTVWGPLLQYLSLSPLSLHMSLSHSGEDRRGTDRQLMMKYDPMICGLSAVEDVKRERESPQTCSGKLQQMGEDFFFLFFFPTLHNFHLCDTQSCRGGKHAEEHLMYGKTQFAYIIKSDCCAWYMYF